MCVCRREQTTGGLARLIASGRITDGTALAPTRHGGRTRSSAHRRRGGERYDRSKGQADKTRTTDLRQRSLCWPSWCSASSISSSTTISHFPTGPKERSSTWDPPHISRSSSRSPRSSVFWRSDTDRLIQSERVRVFWLRHHAGIGQHCPFRPGGCQSQHVVRHRPVGLSRSFDRVVFLFRKEPFASRRISDAIGCVELVWILHPIPPSWVSSKPATWLFLKRSATSDPACIVTVRA